jgi:hypothetical protein
MVTEWKVMELDAAAACLGIAGMFSRSRNSLLLWNLEICCHVHKNLLLNPLLSHLNTICALTAHLFNIHVSIELT